MLGSAGDRAAAASERPLPAERTPRLAAWSVAAGPKGVAFVSMTSDDRIYALTDADGDHRVDRVQIIASGLQAPSGITYRRGSLYVTVISRILRIDDIDARLENLERAVRVPDPRAKRDQQGWRYIRFGRDGWLYIPIGAHGALLVGDDDGSAVDRAKFQDRAGSRVTADLPGHGSTSSPGVALRPVREPTKERAVRSSRRDGTVLEDTA